MAGPYYADPAGSNTSPYDTWAKAATSIQTVLDLAVAGEIIYCRGTQTLAATLDIDTQTGTNAAGWIKVIGCNASGNVDGTRFVVDANNGSYHAITIAAGSDLYWFENIESKNTGVGTYNGFHAAANSDGHVMINCCANDCGASGFNFSASYNVRLFRCVSYANTLHGYYLGGIGMALFFCASRDNTTDGFFLATANTLFYACVSHGNSDDGAGNTGGIFLNSVIDGNADDGIDVLAGTNVYAVATAIGCRITNHSGAGDIGFNANSEPCILGFSYFEDNDGDNIGNATVSQVIPLEGGSATSNLEDLANTNEGYVDKTNHDFSTGYTDSGDPDARRTAITIPWS